MQNLLTPHMVVKQNINTAFMKLAGEIFFKKKVAAWHNN